jgi:hypothetical protein
MKSLALVGFTLAIACSSAKTVAPPEPVVPLGPYGPRAAEAAKSEGATEFLRGTFDRLRYTVQPSGEQFTVVHEDSRMRVAGGPCPTSNWPSLSRPATPMR